MTVTGTTLTIADVPPLTVTLTTSVDVLVETAGPTPVVLTATLSATTSTATTVTISLRGTASKGADYSVTPDPVPSITIAARERTGTVTVEVDPVQDDLAEPGGETVVVAGTATGGTTFTVTGTRFTITEEEEVATVSAPKIVGIRVGNQCGVIGTGQALNIEVVFSTPVVVAGYPVVMLPIGNSDRVAEYTGGNGSYRLVFKYVVAPGDLDQDGVDIGANALGLNGGTIQGVRGRRARIRHSALSSPCHTVNGRVPVVTDIIIASRPAMGQTYWLHEEIELRLRFTLAVTVVGDVRLRLTLGDGTRDMRCLSGRGVVVRCMYRVVAGDWDDDGVSVRADALSVRNGSIRAGSGSAAALAHRMLENQSEHRVGAVRPSGAESIRDVMLVAGGEKIGLDLGSVFRGSRLTLRAVSSDVTVVGVTTAGGRVTIISGREGSAVIRVTAENPLGESAQTFRVMVTTDPAEVTAWTDVLSSVGRTGLRSVQRMIEGRRHGRTDTTMRLAGIDIPVSRARRGPSIGMGARQLWTESDHEVQATSLDGWPGARAVDMSAVGSTRGLRQAGSVTPEAWLTGTAFSVGLGGGAGQDREDRRRSPRWSVWGGGEAQSIRGKTASGQYNGQAATGHFGVDIQVGSMLAGIAVSRSISGAAYGFQGRVTGGGDFDTRLFNVTPYVAWSPVAHTDVWVAGGLGWGRATTRRRHVGELTEVGDLRMRMGTIGIRRALGVIGPLEMTARGDMGAVRLIVVDSAAAVGGLTVQVFQTRGAVEGTTNMAFGSVQVEPFMAIAGRHDGGAGAAGRGLEIEGGFRASGGRLRVEARGYRLVLHSASGYEERGMSVTAIVSPATPSGGGLELRVGPRWGADSSSHDQLWGTNAFNERVHNARPDAGGIDIHLGYGLQPPRWPVIRPFMEVSETTVSKRRRIGLQIGRRPRAEHSPHMWAEVGGEWSNISGRGRGVDVTATLMF